MTLPSAKELARTYNTPAYDDPWQSVEDYQRVLEYTAENPSLGSSAVSSRLDLPRGRIRPWMNGSCPDVVHAIQTAEAKNWTSETETQDSVRGVVGLAAWILSAGSLNLDDAGRARFALKPDTRTEFQKLASTARIDYEIIREGNNSQPGRATEAVATSDGSVFARILHSLGVPPGPKSESHPEQLPPFVDSLGRDLKTLFATIYLLNRGTPNESGHVVTVQEVRPKSYLDELAELFEDVTGERVTSTDARVTLSKAATRSVGASI